MNPTISIKPTKVVVPFVFLKFGGRENREGAGKIGKEITKTGNRTLTNKHESSYSQPTKLLRFPTKVAQYNQIMMKQKTPTAKE